MGDLLQIDTYELGLLALGLVMLLAAWIPQLFLKRHVTLAFLHLGAGYFLFSYINFDILDPQVEDNRWLWEKLTEFAVILSLLGAGLKIDEKLNVKTWKPALLLLGITMPLTIALVAAYGWIFCGLSIASAVLLGAVLAPTDPVMAAEVQVGPPKEGSDHTRVRFPLTSEAGLNDSLAFPFTYLAIAIANYGSDYGEWVFEWIWKAVFYKIVIGFAIGLLLGYVLSKVIFKYPTEKPLAREGLGCIALCVLFTAYGGAEIIGGYGFLSVFVCAVRLRRIASTHEYHNVLYEFSENLESCGMAIILFLLGGLATVMLQFLDWNGVVLALALLFLIRPLAGYLGLVPTRQQRVQKLAVAFFGIRGIGSVYYLAYAMGVATFDHSRWIWATVIFIILLSSVIHGLSAIPVMHYLERRTAKR